ncbi:protein translocase subunit SecD [Schaalia suimastitidis]|uniref:protein translocase subunit SecD n=1 Tax=Schaalia suimastitidis TaxID=121163 RepID=UPI0009FFF819
MTLVLLTALGVGGLVVGNVTGKGATYVPSLALDLQGGTQLILTPVSTEAESRTVTEDDIAQAINIIRSRVDASGVAEAEITSLGTDNIVVAIPGTPSQETLDLIRSSSQMNFRPVLQIGPSLMTTQVNASTEAITGTDTATTSDAAAQSSTTTDSATTSSAETSATADTATTEATTNTDADATTTDSGTETATTDTSAEAATDTATPQTTTVPALSDEQARAAADTNGDGQLSSEPATTPANNSDLAWITEQVLYDYLTLNCTAGAPRTERASDAPYAACDVSGQVKYILGPVDVSGALLDSASAGMLTNSAGQPTGEWGVDLQFDSEGTTLFAEASTRLYGYYSTDAEGASYFGYPDRNHFAAVLDGSVITAPRMNQVIANGMAQISGNFTAASASALANQLNFGSLPLNFEVQSEQQISATLGSEHLEKGIWAGLIGLLLVVLYMIWQYRGLSIISAGSLLVAGGLTYLVITLLSWVMGYRLSLAGIAGLIVAVGVTADSFIVYFERIRDEVRDGRPLDVAVGEGWDRAKRTILISDAVNLVAAGVLYALAVGGVQGFAFTLGVTTVVDLVVIFLFTHPMMELLIRTRFFGGGHKFSGLDPENLGAQSAVVYAGRGQFRDRRKSTPASANSDTRSLAQRRRAAQEVASDQADTETKEQNA